MMSNYRRTIGVSRYATVYAEIPFKKAIERTEMRNSSQITLNSVVMAIQQLYGCALFQHHRAQALKKHCNTSLQKASLHVQLGIL